MILIITRQVNIIQYYMPNFKYLFDNTNMLEFSAVDKQVYTEMNDQSVLLWWSGKK